ncbi:MAG: FKBP-type peptidyl-prolyl cis-trans isomerase [Desulfobacterales bacterium]|nr:MAG: FKBP-type peptidyl-prolyl cis-trans isomerase [Desulfobacterales bacterium]
MKKLQVLTGALAVLLLFAPASLAEEGVVVTASGLEYMDLVVGTGPAAEVGKVAVIHCTGWLDDNGPTGKAIINSRDRGEPVAFKVGTEGVMQGWNIGVAGMKVGGKRRLMIPSALAYGAKRVEDVIPPNADLIFDIELIEVR